MGPERRSRLVYDGSPAAGAAGGLTLAIDTASGVGGVALYGDEGPLAEETWEAGGNQTTQVLPAVARLWARAGLAPRDTRLIVVSTGPGSFTGLRVGLSIGKGLAMGIGLPLVGVSTLDALAYQHAVAAARPVQLAAVVAAGRGQLYVGWYASRGGTLRSTSEPRVMTAAELGAAVASRPRAVVCGELKTGEVAQVAAGGGDAARVCGPAAGLRRPAFLAELGRWRYSRDGTQEAASIQPLYLRRAGAGGQPAA